MRRAVAILTVIVFATAAAVGAGATGRPVYLLARCGDLTIRPVTVAPCGQYRQELLTLRWSQWGGPRAKATGVLYTNTCRPDCPSGEGRTDRVRVTADRLRACPGGRHEYTRLTYTPVVAGAVPRVRTRFACL
jgi:hypothetical protein